MGVDFGLFVVVVSWGFCLIPFFFFLNQVIDFHREDKLWYQYTSKSEYQQVLLDFFFFKALSAIDANLCIIMSTTAYVVFKQTIHCNWIVTRIERIKAVERTLTTKRWAGLGLSWSDHPMHGTLILRNKRALTLPSDEGRMKQNRLFSKLLLSAYHNFQYRG